MSSLNKAKPGLDYLKCYNYAMVHNKKPRRRYIPRISQHTHSLKLRPHIETSYSLLVFLVLLCAIVLLAINSISLAGPLDPPPPVTGIVTIRTTVPGQSPGIGATINNPSNNTTSHDPIIDISGTCSPLSLVKLTKNDIYSGSVLCGTNGRFKLSISLFNGINNLIATDYNYADLAGPATPTVQVTYAPLTILPLSTATKVKDFVLTSSQQQIQAGFTGDILSWPIDISGGRGPYAVSIDWGDGKQDVLTRSAEGRFIISQAYTKPGDVNSSYAVYIKATDVDGRVAILPVVAIVRSRDKAVYSGTIDSGKLSIAWPILAVALIMVLTFWLGETIAKRVALSRFTAASVRT